jgi:hypothetical protein
MGLGRAREIPPNPGKTCGKCRVKNLYGARPCADNGEHRSGVSMLSSRDKRATLSSGLLAGKDGTPREAPPREADDRELVARAASQSAVARSVIKELREGAKAEEARDAVLASKGAASASGFRPWYWSYERDGSPPQSDSAGTVTPFPASAPSPVSPPDPVSAPATAPPAARTKSHVTPVVVLGVAALALSSSIFFLARLPAENPPPAVAAPVATALPPAPRPAEAPAPAAPPPVIAEEPAAPPPAAPAPLSAEEIRALMSRGDGLLATGDIAAARRFYERAADGGSAAAATAAGKTYDPLFLREAQARGMTGDPVKAARWYRKASEGGDRNADLLMRRLMARYAG